MRGMAMFMAMALVTGQATSVSFVLDTNGSVIVPVTIGGLHDREFLLDTGSTRSVVSEAVAGQLALRPVARSEVVTSAGASMQPVVALPATCLAARCVDGVLALVASQGRLEIAGKQLDGILGSDVLSRGDFTLDYKRRRFEWGADTAGARGEDRLMTLIEDGRTVVIAPQGAGSPLRLVADSGTDAFLFFDSPHVRALSASSGVNRAMLQTLGGAVQVAPVLFPRLRVGGATWMGEIAAVVARPPGYPLTIDGLLPLHRFASVSFRHSEEVLVVRHR